MQTILDAVQILKSSFIKKLVDDGKPKEWVKNVLICPDYTLVRQRRFGFYGWLDYDDEECDKCSPIHNRSIASSIDWIISIQFKNYDDMMYEFNKIFDLFKSEFQKDDLDNYPLKEVEYNDDDLDTPEEPIAWDYPGVGRIPERNVS